MKKILFTIGVLCVVATQISAQKILPFYETFYGQGFNQFCNFLHRRHVRCGYGFCNSALSWQGYKCTCISRKRFVCIFNTVCNYLFCTFAGDYKISECLSYKLDNDKNYKLFKNKSLRKTFDFKYEILRYKLVGNDFKQIFKRPDTVCLRNIRPA